MDQKNIEKFKNKLERKKKEIEERLSLIAKKDLKIEGDWDTKFPNFDKPIGGKISEEAADEVEEYENIKPVEHVLELKLQTINEALKKITRNQYGICEKCQKRINLLRLKISPEAKTCLRCKK